MAELVEVPISEIDPNPYRLLATYPFNERKIETLMRSIADVGLWEGVIARRHGNRYQLAFGHHRIEAARRNKLVNASLIVRDDLNDETLLRFMAHENAEEFNADFLVMLEMWEAASRFKAGSIEPFHGQYIDIARLLGWTRARPDDGEMMDNTAKACHAALALISGGYLSRDDLRGMAIFTAREIVERTHASIELTERLGKKGGKPAKEIEASKSDTAKAAKSVAKDVRDGHVAKQNIRGEIDYRSYKNAHAKGRQSPLFGRFADGVAKNIHKMLVADKTAEKLHEMEQGLPNVELDEDFASLRRVDFALAEHETVTGKWRTRLTRKGEKVVPFKLLKGG